MNESSKESEDADLKDTEYKIYGADIKKKYQEVKGTDFAILVTTMDFLKEKNTDENKENYRYIIENNDTNRVGVIEDAEGNYLDAVFVNYNRLLKDTVVTKDISGGYIAPYGFLDKGETKFNKYVKNKPINIDDNAVFTEYPIYDGSYNPIGILYIENAMK